MNGRQNRITDILKLSLGSVAENENFIKDRKKLMNAILIASTEAENKAYHDKLLDLNPENYAELSNVQWLFNNNKLRSTGELESLAKIINFLVVNKGVDFDEVERKQDHNRRVLGVSGFFFGMTIYSLILAWLWNVTQSMSPSSILWWLATPMTLPVVPILLLLFGVFGAVKALRIFEGYVNSDVLGPWYSHSRFEFEKDGVNFEWCSVKNVFANFFDIETEFELFHKPEPTVKVKTVSSAITFLSIAVFIFGIWLAGSQFMGGSDGFENGFWGFLTNASKRTY